VAKVARTLVKIAIAGGTENTGLLGGAEAWIGEPALHRLTIL
jgi:hypothetical protein